MKKFNKKVTVGTKVQIIGVSDLHTVKSINEQRTLIEVIGYVGSFQVGHIARFTNK